MTMATQHAPTIVVTTHDHLRLSGVVEAFERRGSAELVESLAEELDRAEVVDPTAVPPDVVTMHSKCRFSADGGPEQEVTLVYPGEEDVAQDKISIVTPVGSALIGLRAGHLITWRTIDGRTKTLTVAAVTWQPEANGLDGADKRTV